MNSTIETVQTFLTNNFYKITTLAMSSILLTILNDRSKLYLKYKNLKKEQKILNKEIKAMSKELNWLSAAELKKELCISLFFGDEPGHEDHVITNFNCENKNCSATKIRTILSFINDAKETLDICMYTFTNKTLGDAVMQAAERGVRVRVITDEDMAFATGSQIRNFLQKNIRVHLAGNAPFMMHEKFAIVDNSIVMEGSMNWTTQACRGNCEHVTITGYPEMVDNFVTHFNEFYNKLQVKQNEKIATIKKVSSGDDLERTSNHYNGVITSNEKWD